MPTLRKWFPLFVQNHLVFPLNVLVWAFLLFRGLCLSLIEIWHPNFVIAISSLCDFVSFFCVFFLVMLAHDEPIVKSKVFINLVIEILIGNLPKLTMLPLPSQFLDLSTLDYALLCHLQHLWLLILVMICCGPIMGL